jgi:LmbE family N-acetylglucosaminyl deacetylase
MNKTTNLVIVAHPDDEILGFGATGAKLVEQGEVVQPVILCGGVDARTHRPTNVELNKDMLRANKLLGFSNPMLGSFPNIKMNTVDHLDIVQFIEKQIINFRPTRIFTHHPSDLNDDHVQISKACTAAARLFQRRTDIPKLESLNYMEILSSTDWSFPLNGLNFSPNTYIDIENYLDLKISALACYRSVMKDPPHPRSDEVMRGHAAYRGGQSGFIYAEAFQTVFQTNL